MLLKLLYDFAQSRNVLNDLPFSPKAIRWIIPLDSQGRLSGVGPIETAGEKNRGKEFSAPRTSLDKGVGGIAEFLADGVTALFALDPDPDRRLTPKQRRDRDANNAAKYEHFWSQIRQAFEKTSLPALRAVLSFHEDAGNHPSFLRYGTEAGAAVGDLKPKWWVRTADGSEKRMGPDQFAFQVEGHLLLLDEAVIRPYWRAVYAAEVKDQEAKANRGFCMVTGRENVPVPSTHLPKIKGVPGTQSFGAAIVSFDKPAFASYGFEQSLNAPVSTHAVSAYCNGLNALLSREEHSFTIGQTVLCFWARQSQAASSFVARMLRKPDPQAVADFLRAPWAGVDRSAARLDPFYSITFSGNAGRVVVRHWMQASVEDARENFARWFRDLQIASLGPPQSAKRKKRKLQAGDIPATEAGEEVPPLALFRLACSTVRDAKDLQSEVPAQLYRAALEGASPSVRLLKPILNRLEADLQKYGSKTLLNLSRFALLKLILNRNRKEDDPVIQPLVFETDDRAYNSGRLLAVLAEAQAKAHGYKLEGAGVAERYFGTASVSPSSVFPILLRLNRHHLNKIKKSERFGGDERFLEDAIQGLLAKFKPPQSNQPPQFPRHLDLQEQGRFAIGFYQQKAETDARKAEASKDKESKTK
jgi:CRISPR-associated protein Csd1